MTYGTITNGIDVEITKEPVVTYDVTKEPTINLGINQKQNITIEPTNYRTGWRTNFARNPNFEVDVAGYTATSPSVISRTTSDFYFGTASLEWTNTGGTANRTISVLGPLPAPNLNRFPIDAGATYNISIYGKLGAGTSTLAAVYNFYNSAGTLVSSSSVNLLGLAPGQVGVWARGQRNFTVPTGTGIVAMNLVLRWSSMIGGSTSYLDGLLFELNSGAPLPYFDGSYNQVSPILEPVSSWSGTPNLSASNLTYQELGTLTISETVLV